MTYILFSYEYQVNGSEDEEELTRMQPSQADDYYCTQARPARFVAKSTLEAWEQLPYHGETFISISTVWMEDYINRLEKEFD